MQGQSYQVKTVLEQCDAGIIPSVLIQSWKSSRSLALLVHFFSLWPPIMNDGNQGLDPASAVPSPKMLSAT